WPTGTAEPPVRQLLPTPLDPVDPAGVDGATTIAGVSGGLGAAPTTTCSCCCVRWPPRRRRPWPTLSFLRCRPEPGR
ncbi:MAG TPA: hypothetical protein VIJ05_06610, partial [Actinomycetes bacterium]